MASRGPRLFEPGRLRERIAIQRQRNERVPGGGYDRSWQTLPGLGRVPAEVLGGGSSEAVVAARLQGTSTYRITIRHREGIQESDRIMWRGLELNIRGEPVDPTGRRELLQIFADTSSPQGND